MKFLILFLIAFNVNAHTTEQSQQELDYIIVSSRLAGQCATELRILAISGRKTSQFMTKYLTQRASNVGKTLVEYINHCKQVKKEVDLLLQSTGQKQ